MAMKKKSTITFCLCLAVLLARASSRLIYPEVWAEDGTIYISESLRGGFSTLLDSRLGSYHLVQRFLTLVSIKLFPLKYVPRAMAATYFVVCALVFSMFSLERFAWLVKSSLTRILFCAALCMAPGLHEMLGNLANLNWILFFGLGLILLQDPRSHLGALALSSVTAIVLSTGTFILLLPLALWRVGDSWIKRRARANLRSALLAAGVIGFGAFWLVTHKGDRPPLESTYPILQVLQTYSDHLVRHGILQPLFGDHLAIELSNPQWRWLFDFVGGLFLVSLVIWLVKNRDRSRKLAIVSFFGGTSMWTILCWLARPNALSAFDRPLIYWFFQIRYSFPTSVAALFLFLVWAESIPRLKTPSFCSAPFRIFNQCLKRLRGSVAAGFPAFGEVAGGQTSYLALLILSTNLAVSSYRFFIPRLGVVRLWKNQVGSLSSSIETGCPHSINVEIYPPGWVFNYTSPKAPVLSCAAN